MRELKIRNFRDVSGYQNQDGQVMKKNKIFRGASLDQITFDDALYMEKELGIHYILDYRDEKESLMSQDIVFPNAIYERISALQVKEATDEGFDFGSMLQGEMTLEKLKFLLSYVSEGYKTMAFDNPAYHKLFELLLRNDGHVYFHCTAGKDRTGVSAVSYTHLDVYKRQLNNNVVVTTNDNKEEIIVMGKGLALSLIHI